MQFLDPGHGAHCFLSCLLICHGNGDSNRACGMFLCAVFAKVANMLSDFKNYEGFDIVFIFFGLLTHFAVAGDILIPGDTSSQLSLFYMYLKIQQSIMNVVKENSRCWGKVQVEESFYNPMMCTAQASLSLVPYSDSVSL